MISINEIDPAATFVWIPSHVGIRSNATVDRLAKDGTTRQSHDTLLSLEVRDEFVIIDEFVERLWQAEYSASKNGQACRTL